MLALIWDDDNQWATLTAYRDGTEQWSVYGCVEDDYVRVTGGVPADLGDLLAAREDCEEVPRAIAKRLTGFAVDDGDDATRNIQVMRFETESPEIEEGGDPPPQITTRVSEQSATLLRVSLDVGSADDDEAGDDETWLGFSIASRDGDRLVVATKDEHMFAIDTATFPPTFTALGDGTCDAAALTPWRSTLVAVTDDSSGSLVREIGGAHPQWIPLPFDAVAIGGMRGVPAGVVVFPGSWASGDMVPHLITARPDGRRDVTPLALPRAVKGDDPTAIGFGDGSFLIALQGRAYHWQNGAILELDPLGIDESISSGITAHDGSILLRADENALVRLRSDGSRERIAAFESVYQLARGPGDAVIVADADPDAALKIWWPGTNAVTSVSSEQFELEEDPEVIYYDRHHELLCVLATGLHAMPWRVIARLPRG